MRCNVFDFAAWIRLCSLQFCSYEAGSNPHVIGRFYYSSDYRNMPVFSLG